MYRVFYRGGSYRDTPNPPMMLRGSEIWAVVNLEIIEGGDAYQALLRTLEVEV